jgi:NAD(P)-dependent dehydrogenase (short-subunit alcohol dehydrogenase family)
MLIAVAAEPVPSEPAIAGQSAHDIVTLRLEQLLRADHVRIGEPEDMAAAAIYLASRAGDYVVGETLTVDGGVVNATLGNVIE